MFHKSAKGRVVNFDELARKNSSSVAVGNANLNARGDVLGRNGEIIQTAESRMAKMSSSTAKVSIQSEIAALRAARNNWTADPVSDEAVDEVESEVEAATDAKTKSSESSRKPRNIVETE